MNYAIVFRLLGYVLMIEGALLLLPAAASWIYGEWFVLGVFLITAAVPASATPCTPSNPAARCSICAKALQLPRCAGCSSR